MKTEQLQTDFPEVQAAIYRVALSLDSFLLNGIPYGVLHQDIFKGFEEKTAGTLLAELGSLEQYAPHTPDINQAKATAILASLRAKCQQLIEVVSGLKSFAALPLDQLRSAVSQVPLLRADCAQLIQELEACFQTPKPFYSSRPSHSTAGVNEFLANLERAFVEAWNGANAGRQE